MSAPPAGPRRRQQGKLRPLTAEHKRKREVKRRRKKTWVARVWARRHIKGQA